MLRIEKLIRTRSIHSEKKQNIRKAEDLDNVAEDFERSAERNGWKKRDVSSAPRDGTLKEPL